MNWSQQLNRTRQEFEASFTTVLLPLAILPIPNETKELLVKTVCSLNSIYHNLHQTASYVINTVNQLGVVIPAPLRPSPYLDPINVLGSSRKAKCVYRVSPLEFYLHLELDRNVAEDITNILNSEVYREECEVNYVDYSPVIYGRYAIQDHTTGLWCRGYVLPESSESALSVNLIDVGTAVHCQPNEVLPLDDETYALLNSPPTAYRCRLSSLCGPAEVLPWHPSLIEVLYDICTSNGLQMDFQYTYRGPHQLLTYLVKPTDLDISPFEEVVQSYFTRGAQCDATTNASTSPIIVEISDTSMDTATEEQASNELEQTPHIEQPLPLPPDPLLTPGTSTTPRPEPEGLQSPDGSSQCDDLWAEAISLIGSSDDEFLNAELPDNQPRNDAAVLTIDSDSPLSFVRQDDIVMMGIPFKSPIVAILYLLLLQMTSLTARAANQAAWLLMSSSVKQAISRYISERQRVQLPLSFLAEKIIPAAIVALQECSHSVDFRAELSRINSQQLNIVHHSYPEYDLDAVLYHCSYALIDFVYQTTANASTVDVIRNSIPFRLHHSDRILVISDTALTASITFDGPITSRKVIGLLADSPTAPNRSATNILRKTLSPTQYSLVLCILGPQDVSDVSNAAALRKRYQALAEAALRFQTMVMVTEPIPRLDAYACNIPEACHVLRTEALPYPNIKTISMHQMDEPQKMLNPATGTSLADHSILRLMRILLQHVPQLQLTFRPTNNNQ